MSFKILLLAPDLDPSWPDKIRQAVPGVDVRAFADPKDAAADIADADAAWLGVWCGAIIGSIAAVFVYYGTLIVFSRVWLRQV